MVLKSFFVTVAFFAVTSSRHLVSQRNRFQRNSNSRVYHNRMSPLVLQEFSQLSQYENSPIRRDSAEYSLPIYLLNPKSKHFKAMNSEDLIKPDSTKIKNLKKMEQPFKVLEVDQYTESDSEPLVLSPLFDAKEIGKIGQLVSLVKDESTTEKTVFDFNELVI